MGLNHIMMNKFTSNGITKGLKQSNCTVILVQTNKSALILITLQLKDFSIIILVSSLSLSLII